MPSTGSTWEDHILVLALAEQADDGGTGPGQQVCADMARCEGKPFQNLYVPLTSDALPAKCSVFRLVLTSPHGCHSVLTSLGLLQGGTCVMMGDDHSRIAAASKLAAKQIGCKVFKGSPYYRKEGVHPFRCLW